MDWGMPGFRALVRRSRTARVIHQGPAMARTWPPGTATPRNLSSGSRRSRSTGRRTQEALVTGLSYVRSRARGTPAPSNRQAGPDRLGVPCPPAARPLPRGTTPGRAASSGPGARAGSRPRPRASSTHRQPRRTCAASPGRWCMSCVPLSGTALAAWQKQGGPADERPSTGDHARRRRYAKPHHPTSAGGTHPSRHWHRDDAMPSNGVTSLPQASRATHQQDRSSRSG